ncbi:MAG: NADH-quinone oxidoreductase subunit [Frankiaceae bacterium]|jgi:NADH-quinone oxidoreductase subunit M|nr:NADH-quinone oxidoreductase subunit [Frankiaceae bacterium]
MSVALPLLLGVPAAGAALLAAVPMSERRAKVLGVLASGATLVVVLVLTVGFDFGAASRLQDGVDVRWLPAIDVRFHLGVDGISLPLVILTALLTLLCAIYTVGSVPEAGRVRQLLALVLLLEVGVLGTFVAADLIVFFVFFEIVLIPMYFLIAAWGGPGRRPAATKFILFTLLGSALMLVGFLVIYAGAGTFDMTALAHAHGRGIGAAPQLFAFVLLLIGFGIKSPMWPLHTWLPDAHTEAPTVGSVLLAGVLLKMGTYGLVRIAVADVPDGARRAAPALGILAVVGVVYAAFACLALVRSGDLKRLIAFSSVGHMGFVLLGIATLTPVGIQGALIGNVAHGVITGLLFFLVGGMKDRFHTSEIEELGGGLLAKVPVLGGLTLFAAIASLGLPGLAGFWGEMLAMLGAWSPAAALSRPLFIVLMAVAGAGTILTAVYFLAMLRRVDFGVVTARWREAPIPDAVAADLVAWVPLTVLALSIGVWPRLVLGVSDAAVRGLLR